MTRPPPGGTLLNVSWMFWPCAHAPWAVPMGEGWGQGGLTQVFRWRFPVFIVSNSLKGSLETTRATPTLLAEAVGFFFPFLLVKCQGRKCEITKNWSTMSYETIPPWLALKLQPWPRGYRWRIYFMFPIHLRKEELLFKRLGQICPICLCEMLKVTFFARKKSCPTITSRHFNQKN